MMILMQRLMAVITLLAKVAIAVIGEDRFGNDVGILGLDICLHEIALRRTPDSEQVSVKLKAGRTDTTRKVLK